MPTYPATYQAADAQCLQPVAALANGDVSQVTFIPGPGGWSVLQTIGAEQSSSGTQAIIATVTLPSDGNQYAVIACGQPWPGILSPYYFTAPNPAQGNYGLLTLDDTFGSPPPPQSGPPNAPLFCNAYQQQYLGDEPGLFTALNGLASTIGSLPLIVIGQAQGAPLAQLAALAFRSAREGLPAGLSTAACYTFSTPPMGDTGFAAWFQQTVPAAFNVAAKSVDFFAAPLAPLPSAALAGQAVPLASPIPSPDDPWVEHGGAFYTALLGGTPDDTTIPGGVQNPPGTYNSELACTLAQLCAAVYQQAQHPDLAPAPNVAGYPLYKLLTYSGITWGGIFVNAPNSRVVVAFRGATGFEETVAGLAQGGVGHLPYLGGCSPGSTSPKPGFAGLGPGIATLYDAMRADLLAKISAALAAAGGAQVYLAGHDIGGILANVAALDLAQNGAAAVTPATVSVPAVYTFGAPPGGDLYFQTAFNLKYFANPAAPASFQLARPDDPFPTLMLTGGTNTANAALSLGGATPWDDGISHSLTSYLSLLAPGHSLAAELAPPEPE